MSPAESQVADRQLRAVDVILECVLVIEAEHPRAFASDVNRKKALLVLKQVPVLDDGSLEGFTDFQQDTVAKDDSLVVFEASGKRHPPCVPVLLGSIPWDSPPVPAPT